MLIDTFMKNSFEQVRTEISEFQGKKYLNIRVWYNSGDREPDYKPSKKGITLSIELIDDLKEAVAKAGKEIYEQLPGA